MTLSAFRLLPSRAGKLFFFCKDNVGRLGGNTFGFLYSITSLFLLYVAGELMSTSRLSYQAPDYNSDGRRKPTKAAITMGPANLAMRYRSDHPGLKRHRTVGTIFIL